MNKKVISVGAILCGVALLSCVVQAQPAGYGGGNGAAEDWGGIGDAVRVPQEYSTIQAAVDAAMPKTTILLADGTYTGPGNRGVTINKPLTIRGIGGPERCIIDCEGVTRAFTVQLDDPNALVVFEGMTLKNGGNVFDGGAILFDGGGSAKLTDCVIRDNQATNDWFVPARGGGICALGVWRLEIQNSRFEDNQVHGWEADGNDSCYVAIGQDAYGGGIFCEAGEMDIRDCILSHNICHGGDDQISSGCWRCEGGGWAGGGYASGGAICGGRSSPPRLSLLNSIIVGCEIKCGIRLAYDDGSCMGFRDQAYGSAVAFCSGIVRNCTFHLNRRYYDYDSASYGDVFGAYRGTIINSIFEWQPLPLQDAQIAYCCTTGTVNGSGNITGDPLFASPGYWDNNGTPWFLDDDFFIPGDYHLKSTAGRWDPMTQTWVKDSVTSPCIDAGDPADQGWKNELWPNGRRIDIGAYGGTAEASMSPNAIGLAADLNFDNVIDVADLLLMAQAWTKHQVLLAADLTRDGRVGIEDLAVMAESWME
jgi:hypothetical protein